MTLRARRRMTSLLGLVAALGLPLAEARAEPTKGAFAETPSGAKAKGEADTSPEDAAQAREHFKRARELYGAGAYRDAISELEAAHALDPHAKDLVFNLGVVNEKLGHLEEALKWFQKYAQMDLDAGERARADSYIKRLEGAKSEVKPVVRAAEPPPPPPPPPAEKPAKGRVDGATVAAAGVTVVAVGVGAFFGVKALSDQPKSFITGRDGSYADLQNQNDRAHREATVSDIAFGAGLAAGLLTAYLYFGRSKSPSPPAPAASVSAVTVRGGAAFVLRGTF